MIYTSFSLRFGAMLLLCGCTNSYSVEQYGGMREVLREGHTQPRIALRDVTGEPGAIAVGALAGLGGEITIVYGETWVARSIDGNANVTGPTTSPHDQATLLTASHVDSWIEITLPDGATAAQLAKMVSDTASNHGLNSTNPFPFIIEGDFRELELHVIAGSCPIANPNGEQPWRYTSTTPIHGLLVGFHAQDQEGVMTHHSSNVHMHALIPGGDDTLTGHVDHVIVEPGGILRIPSDS